MLRKTQPENPYIHVLEEVKGKCPPMPEKLLCGLADQLDEANRLEEAAAALEAYGRWAQREYGAEHFYVVEAWTMRGSCYERLGEYHDACTLYRRVLATPGLDVDSEYIAEIQKYVTEQCDALPERSSTPPALGPLPLGERSVSPPLEEIEPELESIGDILFREGHYEEAVSAYEGAQAWLERTEGADDPSVPTLLAKRAECHVHLGQDELGCRLYERAMRLVESSEEPDQEFLRSASEYLAENCR